MQNSIVKTILALALTTAAACGGDATCDQVADKILDLAPAQFKDQMGDKSKLVAQCEEQNLSAEERKCAVNASDFAALTACKKKK